MFSQTTKKIKTSLFLSFQAIVVAFCFLFPHHSLSVCRFCQQLCGMEQLCKLGLHQLLGQTFFVFPFALQESKQCRHGKTFCQINVFKKMPNLFLKWHSLFKSILHKKIRFFAQKINIKPFARFSANVCVVPIALKYATNFFIFLSFVKIFYHNFLCLKKKTSLFSIFPFNNIDKKLIF